MLCITCADCLIVSKAEVTRLRAEVDRLRKRVKLEEGGTAERPVKLENGCASAGQIIDLVSDDES